jgi:hypothetical protein
MDRRKLSMSRWSCCARIFESRSSFCSPNFACSSPCMPLLRAPDNRCCPQEGGDDADGVSVIVESDKTDADAALDKIKASYGVLFDDEMLVLR